MPFGLCNATATFQRLMAQALTRMTKKYGNLVMCYVHDVVIETPTLADHIDRLDEVFNCMKKAAWKCKPSILRDSIKYLGRILDRHSVRTDPDAVEAMLTWKAPRANTQLKKSVWNERAQEAFENIKRERCEAPVLGMLTERSMYVLDTDASVGAISGILHQ